MKVIEHTLDSQEVAEMVKKTHANLLKDIRNYIEHLTEVNFYSGDFFTESTYQDANKQSRPCYKVTKKGCEFIAHKLTGVKGTEFTAKYINRFHDMEHQIKSVPAASSRKVTFIQEIKAAEYVVKGLDQRQKLEFYKEIYKRHGLRFDIEPEHYIEDRNSSRCEQYRNESIQAIRKIRDEVRLQQIFTITKKMLEFDTVKGSHLYVAK